MTTMYSDDKQSAKGMVPFNYEMPVTEHCTWTHYQNDVQLPRILR